MTKISSICLAAVLLFAACENKGSSTVGVYENEESSESSDKSEGPAKEENADNKNAAHAYIDTSKTDAGFKKKTDNASYSDTTKIKQQNASDPAPQR